MSVGGFILRVCVFTALLLNLSGCSRGRVIPSDKLSDIYTDMFLADQWLNKHSSERSKADTTLFYEAVFRSYGYSFKDYDRSVNYYLNHTEKFADILKESMKKLEARRDYLQAWVDFLDNKNELLRSIEKRSFNASDSLRWLNDTLVLWPLAVIADSLAARDSLAVRDSVAACDSLIVRDSLAIRDTIASDVKPVAADSIKLLPIERPRRQLTERIKMEAR